MEANVLMAVYRFPDDEELVALDAPAKTAFLRSAFALEPILFGKWRD